MLTKISVGANKEEITVLINLLLLHLHVVIVNAKINTQYGNALLQLKYRKGLVFSKNWKSEKFRLAPCWALRDWR